MNAPANITKPVEFSLPIKNYDEFYHFYLTEHRSIASRRLHVAGSSIGLYFFSKAILHLILDQKLILVKLIQIFSILQPQSDFFEF
jgi:hypothetical protein